MISSMAAWEVLSSVVLSGGKSVANREQKTLNFFRIQFWQTIVYINKYDVPVHTVDHDGRETQQNTDFD